MRKLVILTFMLFLFALVMWIHLHYSEVLSDDLMQYYVSNYYEDTKAENAVAGIILNYRVYDTLFEALTLLISVVAVIHFYRGKER